MERRGHTHAQSTVAHGPLRNNRFTMKGTVIQILLLGYCGIILVSRIEAANPNYSYQVKLSDPLMGNFQEKGEKRLGEKTEGFYR